MTGWCLGSKGDSWGLGGGGLEWWHGVGRASCLEMCVFAVFGWDIET